MSGQSRCFQRQPDDRMWREDDHYNISDSRFFTRPPPSTDLRGYCDGSLSDAAVVRPGSRHRFDGDQLPYQLFTICSFGELFGLICLYGFLSLCQVVDLPHGVH